jgi:hypothetical protein
VRDVTPTSKWPHAIEAISRQPSHCAAAGRSESSGFSAIIEVELLNPSIPGQYLDAVAGVAPFS